MTLEITPEIIECFQQEVEGDSRTQLAINACWKQDPLDVCLRRDRVIDSNHTYTHKVENEAKPVTNQKNSGRCWIFACLNVIRLPFMKQHNLEEFEFSQAYLYFWDKIERCNYFLNKMVECAKKGEEVEGRLVSFLLYDPTCDGGQWDMLVNLIEKYGLMPKKCYPESYCTEKSLRLNRILKCKLREYTKELRTKVEESADNEAISETIKAQMEEIFRTVSICLGVPPKEFTWEYNDKSKVYHSMGPISPLNFYKTIVKPLYDVKQKVCLVSDPRPKNPFGQLYTVDCLGNVVGGQLTIYNNQPIELLMDLCAKSIKDGDAVWFGCEIQKKFSLKYGILDLDIHDYNSLFGFDVHVGLNKADRLIYGDSLMTHAMTFMAVSLDDSGAVKKFRVENSWGDDRGDKGYISMTPEWFKEFVFEVVVDKRFVPAEVLDVFTKEPIVLPAWDPMGSLANNYL